MHFVCILLSQILGKIAIDIGLGSAPIKKKSRKNIEAQWHCGLLGCMPEAQAGEETVLVHHMLLIESGKSALDSRGMHS